MTFPSFATGDVLTAADMNAVGLWLVKTQTVGSAVSSVTVSGAFSSTYQNYKIIYTGGTASAAVGDLFMTLGSTATGYYWGSSRVNYNGGTFAGNGSGAAASPVWRVGSLASTRIHMNCDLFQPFTAVQASYSSMAPYIGGGSGYSFAMLGGYLDDTTSYTAFTLTPNAGTITGGVIRVYGYRD
jgi:hypothetical protein